MQISCPKCQTKYNIDKALVPEDGKKFRCAKCKYVWLVTKEAEAAPIPEPTPPMPQEKIDPEAPVVEETSVTETVLQEPTKTEETAAEDEAVQIQEQMDEAEEKESTSEEEASMETNEKPSEASQSMEEGKEIPSSLKDISTAPASYDFSFTDEKKSNKISTVFIFLFFLASVATVLYFSRNYIVSKFPPVQPLYEMFGVSFEVLGEGLEFKDITREKLIIDDVSFLQVQGTIINISQKIRPVPDIILNLLDNKQRRIQYMTSSPSKSSLAPGESIDFEIRLESPSVVATDVVLTFIDSKTNGKAKDRK